MVAENRCCQHCIDYYLVISLRLYSFLEQTNEGISSLNSTFQCLCQILSLFCQCQMALWDGFTETRSIDAKCAHAKLNCLIIFDKRWYQDYLRVQFCVKYCIIHYIIEFFFYLVQTCFLKKRKKIWNIFMWRTEAQSKYGIYVLSFLTRTHFAKCPWKVICMPWKMK